MKSKKNSRQSAWIQTASNIGSLVVAIVALVITFNTEKRSAERFRAQLEQSNKIAKANIRPLLSLASSGFTGIKLIALTNEGLGTAVVTKIRFINAENSVFNLADLFEFKQNVIWDNYYTFTESNFFLPAGEELVLIHLTTENLKNQGYSGAEASGILENFQKQLKRISIQIEYQDLLENEQQPINATF